MVVRVAALTVTVAATLAHAEADPRVWHAQPAATASSGALVRIGAGQVEQHAYSNASPVAVMMIVRPHVRVTRALQLDASIGGELGGGESIALSSPAFAATWLADIDPVRLAVRGTASLAIANRLTGMEPSVASSLLAHDPLVAWPEAHALGMQVSLQGHAGVLWWGAAASVSQLIPTDLPRQQTLVRADVGIAGPLGRCWTWSLELGASSDALDEEFDEGTDLVPLWSAGVLHHRGSFSIGATTTGGWVGGTRRDLLGPSILIDMRGPL